MLSIPHMIVVFIVVLVVFGPNKLPELARGLGKLMAEFRKASTDFKGAFEQEMRDMERQTMLAERKKAAEVAASAAAAAPQQPATLATPPGTETQPAESPAAGATGESADGDLGSTSDTRATEALVVTPVAEAIARNTSDSNNNNGNDGLSHIADAQNTIGHPNHIAPPQEAPTASVDANDPAHDTQQPA